MDIRKLEQRYVFSQRNQMLQTCRLFRLLSSVRAGSPKISHFGGLDAKNAKFDTPQDRPLIYLSNVGVTGTADPSARGLQQEMTEGSPRKPTSSRTVPTASEHHQPELLEQFIAEGGTADDFEPRKDPDDGRFAELMHPAGPARES